MFLMVGFYQAAAVGDKDQGVLSSLLLSFWPCDFGITGYNSVSKTTSLTEWAIPHSENKIQNVKKTIY